ncbi:hypothetical protein Hanom_Chr03g00219721 [Helianthus anomalus]
MMFTTSLSFSELTQTEVYRFFLDHGIDPSHVVVAPMDRTADQCPVGSVVFYVRILEQPNFRYPS